MHKHELSELHVMLKSLLEYLSRKLEINNRKQP